VKLYTHLSDQYGPYHSTTISATASEAPYLGDGLRYNETDLEIGEHYSDTGAFTDQIFGICPLLGFRYAPRIRDLGDKRLIQQPFGNRSNSSLPTGIKALRKIRAVREPARRPRSPRHG
jgi:TnpA family transposase